MAYSFQKQGIGQFQLNAYNTDKTLTLKNVSSGAMLADGGVYVINGIIKLITIAGAQTLYPITDSKLVSDERVIST